ncbi:MAG TPA: A/G-specific adenine glycosylase [Candidatus Binatia bacterium]|nr:A/G-specific adenine glycosylase [Candidatus Binatia bacterium]
MPALARSARSPVDNADATRENLRQSLLSWYDRAGRSLPWRARDRRADPYRVWLSEVMLQQTTVAAVIPYFARFLERWPTVADLAAARRDDVLGAWAGLGYYSRARNLHAAAQRLAAEGFPETEAGWLTLPGVGPYTAAAIAAIAFDEATNVVDGNVERVVARLRAVETPLPDAKPVLRALAGELIASERPGDWAQALMDLGATVCTPKSPKCVACPWVKACAAYASGAPETYPRRAVKVERPQRYGAAFRIERNGSFWLVRRPDNGLLGGMAALPTTEWRAKKWRRADAFAHAPASANWKKIGQVEHVFTHFALMLDVYAAQAQPAGEGWWGEASVLPTVFRKATRLPGR